MNHAMAKAIDAGHQDQQDPDRQQGLLGGPGAARAVAVTGGGWDGSTPDAPEGVGRPGLPGA